VLTEAIFLAARLSSSRPPRLGRSLRSRRMRSDSPTLDPEATHKGIGACENDGQDQDMARAGGKRAG